MDNQKTITLLKERYPNLTEYQIDSILYIYSLGGSWVDYFEHDNVVYMRYVLEGKMNNVIIEGEVSYEH